MHAGTVTGVIHARTLVRLLHPAAPPALLAAAATHPGEDVAEAVAAHPATPAHVITTLLDQRPEPTVAGLLTRRRRDADALVRDWLDAHPQDAPQVARWCLLATDPSTPTALVDLARAHLDRPWAPHLLARILADPGDQPRDTLARAASALVGAARPDWPTHLAAAATTAARTWAGVIPRPSAPPLAAVHDESRALERDRLEQAWQQLRRGEEPVLWTLGYDVDEIVVAAQRRFPDAIAGGAWVQPRRLSDEAILACAEASDALWVDSWGLGALGAATTVVAKALRRAPRAQVRALARRARSGLLAAALVAWADLGPGEVTRAWQLWSSWALGTAYAPTFAATFATHPHATDAVRAAATCLATRAEREILSAWSRTGDPAAAGSLVPLDDLPSRSPLDLPALRPLTDATLARHLPELADPAAATALVELAADFTGTLGELLTCAGAVAA